MNEKAIGRGAVKLGMEITPEEREFICTMSVEKRERWRERIREAALRDRAREERYAAASRGEDCYIGHYATWLAAVASLANDSGVPNPTEAELRAAAEHGYQMDTTSLRMLYRTCLAAVANAMDARRLRCAPPSRFEEGDEEQAA